MSTVSCRPKANCKLPASRLLAVAAAAACLGSGPALAQDPTAFYAGRTIRLLIGMPPGGGVDTYARLVQRHIQRHLPSAPTIIAQNMPGAGSLRAVQSLANSPEDGTVVATFSSSLITASILAPKRVKVDFRTFSFLGNVSEDSRVCFVRSALGIATWSDITKHDQVVFGGTAAGTSGNLDAAMLRNLFGLKIKLVQGYSGAAQKRLAFEKGEIDGDCAGVTSIPPDWLRQGKIKILIKHSPNPLPGVGADVPFGGDLLKDATARRIYDFLITPQSLGRLFLVPGKVPAERLVALRRAFDEAMSDPAFRAEATKLGLIVSPLAGAAVDARVAQLYATPDALVERARAIASE